MSGHLADYMFDPDFTADVKEVADNLRARRKFVNELVTELQHAWCDCTGTTLAPKPNLIIFLLTENSPEVVDRALRITANKVALGIVPNKGERWYPYLLGVIRNLNSAMNRPLLTTEDLEMEDIK